MPYWKFILLLMPLFISQRVAAQLKFVVEDFEGLANDPSLLSKNGIFFFGNASAQISATQAGVNYYEGKVLKVGQGKGGEGGWGKGLGLFVELDVSVDHLNFYVSTETNKSPPLKIELQEDDDGDGKYTKEKDDSWICVINAKKYIPEGNGAQLVSVPLSNFKDGNQGGDGIFNCGYKQGKLLSVMIALPKQRQPPQGLLSFDFLCFSKGPLVYPMPKPGKDSFCIFGLWSKEGSEADFIQIARDFEKNFGTEKKPGVIHFFQALDNNEINADNSAFFVQKVNELIQEGYLPMITFENRYIHADPKFKQPNLYSILEGHQDQLFTKWAQQVKLIKGTVLVRILHEFNGNWYPWCIANNDGKAELFVKAYRHIRDIFSANAVTNAKFIWCPNSMSVPQEPWNFIMDAYPGHNYVDLVGMDVYNGAGYESFLWRSFRKEGMENYFLLTQYLPDKPLIVCETASRERLTTEPYDLQTKGQWIAQLSEALKTDMAKIKLLSWFNEKSMFKLNSSFAAQEAFLKYIIKDSYFRSGASGLLPADQPTTGK